MSLSLTALSHTFLSFLAMNYFVFFFFSLSAFPLVFPFFFLLFSHLFPLPSLHLQLTQFKFHSKKEITPHLLKYLFLFFSEKEKKNFKTHFRLILAPSSSQCVCLQVSEVPAPSIPASSQVQMHRAERSPLALGNVIWFHLISHFCSQRGIQIIPGQTWKQACPWCWKSQAECLSLPASWRGELASTSSSWCCSRCWATLTAEVALGPCFQPMAGHRLPSHMLFPLPS